MNAPTHIYAFRGFFVGIVYCTMFSVLFNLSGCVYAKYNAADGKEELTVISLLKEVDGFSADRKKDSFNIMIDKTRSSDPFEGLAELIETWTQLQNMGISYTPPGTTIPFPVE